VLVALDRAGPPRAEGLFFLQGRQHARSESSAGSFYYDEDISGSEERADWSGRKVFEGGSMIVLVPPRAEGLVFLQGRQHARSEASAGSFYYDEDTVSSYYLNTRKQ
jgi:hypothetical protein